MSETAATNYYQVKVATLLKEKLSAFSMGMFTILLITATFISVLSQHKTSVVATKKIEKAYLAAKPTPVVLKTYVVQEGESLSDIALAQLGDGDRWVEIAKLNNISDINTISAGMKLVLPNGSIVSPAASISPAPSVTPVATLTPVPSVAPTAYAEKGDIGDEGAMTKKANTKIKEYTVQEGEGLWEIAEKVYGDGEMFNEIMKANNIQNPDQIYVGMKLKMPHTK